MFFLRLSGPLLSRFDLLFILLDTPDADLDYKLSSHIISLHTNQSKSNDSPKRTPIGNKSVHLISDATILNSNSQSNSNNFGGTRHKLPGAAKGIRYYIIPD